MSIAPAAAVERTERRDRSGLRWAAVVLGCCALVVGVMELLARVVTPRISQMERRTVLEYRRALEPGNGKPYVLVTGNSLLGAALDIERAQGALGGKFEVRRFLVEQTSFQDWYFGLRRLFRHGARPQAVVLMLSPGQLVARGIRGEYFAYRLLDTSDVWRAAQTLELNPTATVNLAAGNLSAFYGLRTEIRKVLLGRLLPEAPALMQRLAAAKAAPSAPDALLRAATARLHLLRQAVEENGGVLLFVIPPQIDVDGLAQPLREAGRSAGVSVLTPVAPGELDSSYFSDGFHVNARGAAVFTAEFTRQLDAALSTGPRAAAGLTASVNKE